MFPDADFIHLGGDRIDTDCWMSDPGVSKMMKNKNLKTSTDLKNYFFKRMFETIKTVTSKPIAMYSNPSNYDVNWPEDIILIYTGILGEEDKDFRDFLARYPNNPHIFSHLDQFQLSEGLMNEYGSFPEGQTPWWQYIEYFEPS